MQKNEILFNLHYLYLKSFSEIFEVTDQEFAVRIWKIAEPMWGLLSPTQHRILLKSCSNITMKDSKYCSERFLQYSNARSRIFRNIAWKIYERFHENFQQYLSKIFVKIFHEILQESFTQYCCNLSSNISEILKKIFSQNSKNL